MQGSLCWPALLDDSIIGQCGKFSLALVLLFEVTLNVFASLPQMAFSTTFSCDSSTQIHKSYFLNKKVVVERYWLEKY